MSSNKSQLVSLCLMAIIVSLVVSQLSLAAEYPSPPPVPTKFDNPAEVQRYLSQLHNYYMVVGRPRFGKRSGGSMSSYPKYDTDESSTEAETLSQLFDQVDENGDNTISLREFINGFSSSKK